ncbi:type II toxin-antitoxin system VapC family toxin [Terriglobus sp.]|uniref:type II toxin-antitoxin system VapC family toxin n=1 Tax=Terriglobus sp. TaxID=1889013 RepID=UPI003B002C52
MKLLLDSNIVLWLIYQPERVHSRAAELLATLEYERLISDVSLLEITLKLQKGKLEYTANLQNFLTRLEDLAATPLPLTREHILASVQLPQLHADPFDRLLIAQAQIERAVLVTADATIRESDYEVDTMWSYLRTWHDPHAV